MTVSGGGGAGFCLASAIAFSTPYGTTPCLLKTQAQVQVVFHCVTSHSDFNFKTCKTVHVHVGFVFFLFPEGRNRLKINPKV